MLFLVNCKKENDYPLYPGDKQVNEHPVSCEDYVFIALEQTEVLPNCINILFQVIDTDGNGIVGLGKDDFIVKEDGSVVGSESGVTIKQNDEIPSTIKTVLLLDVSTSVLNQLADIKEAAKSLVNNKADNQEIAVYTFSDETDLILDFSESKVDITTAIDNIEIGESSTNMFGALVDVSDLYTDLYTIDEIVAGNIVLFTDGKDTQGSTDKYTAQNALSDKSLYIVALDGADYTDESRSILQSFYPIQLLESEDLTTLPSLFKKVVDNIKQIAGSTYWLYFSSPKRGDNSHSLELTFDCDDYNYESITGSYNSIDFENGSCN